MDLLWPLGGHCSPIITITQSDLKKISLRIDTVWGEGGVFLLICLLCFLKKTPSVLLPKAIPFFRILEYSTFSLLKYCKYTLYYVRLPGVWLKQKIIFVQRESNQFGEAESKLIMKSESKREQGQGSVRKCLMPMMALASNKWRVHVKDLDAMTVVAAIVMPVEFPGVYTYTYTQRRSGTYMGRIPCNGTVKWVPRGIVHSKGLASEVVRAIWHCRYTVWP